MPPRKDGAGAATGSVVVAADEDTKYRYPAGTVPEEDANLFSRVWFVWGQPLFRRAAYLHRRGQALEPDDLLPLPHIDHGDCVNPLFEDAWNELAEREEQQEQEAAAKQQVVEKKEKTIEEDSDAMVIDDTIDTSPSLGKGEGGGAGGGATKSNKRRVQGTAARGGDEPALRTDRIRGALRVVLGPRFVAAGLIKAVNTLLQFSFPLILNAILKFIEQVQTDNAAILGAERDGTEAAGIPFLARNQGYFLSVALFVVMASKAVTENVYFHMVYRGGYQCRVAISTAVYNKSLRLSNTERQSTTLGQLINLMQVDATKIEMFIGQIHVLWDGVLQIVGYMVILYTLIGWPCLVGLVIMIAAGPGQGIIMGKLFAINREMVQYTDQRVKTTNEALQGIQCVKMYTWEDSFAGQIQASRALELDLLRRAAYLRGLSRSYMSALPGVVAVCSFVAYALAVPDANIAASTLFAALVAFDQLRFPLLFYPMALAQLAQAKVSAHRVETFLRMKEVKAAEPQDDGGGDGDDDKNVTSVKTTDTTGAQYIRNENAATGEIILENATVYWTDPNVPLSDSSEHSTNSKSDLNNMSTRSLATVEEGEDMNQGVDVHVRYPKPALKNITMKVSSGQLCAVVGPVASGKSTLCAAVLNETILGSDGHGRHRDGDGECGGSAVGRIVLNGKVAYAGQSAWILNATLRDNVLFGSPYDEGRYDRVVRACQLTYDLQMLEDGDMTEIGERGINLSGGQKQRVSIARAAYSDASTIILDDPLSALDPEVAKRLFDDCIVDLMSGRTRLLVTNQLQFVRSCDSVVALKRGKIVEQGTYEELMSIENGEVKRLLAQSEERMQKRKESVDDENNDVLVEKEGIVTPNKAIAPPVAANAATTKDKKDAKGLVSKEERMIGAVSFAIYKKYMKAGGGYLMFAFIYAVAVLNTTNSVAVTSWVSYWTSDAQYQRHTQAFYLGLYFMLAMTLGVFTFLRVFYIARFGIKAGSTLHNNLLQSILHAPQSFYDTTPIGRIVSRFSKDLYSIDMELVEMVDFFVSMSLQVVMSVGAILFVTPWFGVSLPFLGFFYIRVLNYFREVSRETKRLESISRSPVYAHFSETLGGLSTIRAYGQSSRFQQEFDDKTDRNTRAYYNNKVADRWLSVRLESIGATIAGLSAVFATQVALSGAVSGKELPDSFSSLAGLSLSFAISITGMLNWCVRTFAQMEAAMNAVERVVYYTDEIPQEAPYTTEKLKDAASQSSQSSTPSIVAVKSAGGETANISDSWPNRGEIVLKNLKMKYRPDTPMVLKGLDITIAPGERVGVVGRTGSGKSSLMLTLLRLVEPYLEGGEYEAPISIDGVDILRIGLRDLRSKLGIIPQHPVLFSGTIRSNLDPFDMYTDEQIWAALEQCGLKSKVMEMPGELGAAVAEYGENLSAGTRQMLVLGRALLRQCRVLLLDEATSSVDYETDQAIQRTIREAFPGCTVITIAHRINTILDSDKILVMKDGIAEEFGPPSELLEDENSIFSDIVRHSKAEEN